MRIGSDYPMIEFECCGLHLVEPNAIIGDFLLFSVCVYQVYRMKRYGRTGFFNWWRSFFLIMGTGFLFGGIGHTFFPYLGVWGKYPAWYLGILSTLCIEQGMIELHHSPGFRLIFKRLSFVKGIFGHCRLYNSLQNDGPDD